MSLLRVPASGRREAGAYGAAFVVFCIIGAAALLSGCTTARPYMDGALPPVPLSDADLRMRVFLVGGTGDADSAATAPVRALLRARLAAADSNSALLFLGDLTPGGLPPADAPERAEAEARLDPWLAAAEGFPGRVLVVPGEADWNDSAPGGAEAVQRLGAYVQERLGREDVLLPGGGLPGPVALKLADGLRLIALDTAWWLYPHRKPIGGEGEAYDPGEPADVLLELDGLLRRYDDDDVLVVGHHPLRSNGPHGGYFPPRLHLFPLTAWWDAAYVPFPIVGTIPLLAARFAGRSRQDLAHPRYRELRTALDDLFMRHESLIYAAAHDGSLQHFQTDGPDGPRHELVSGAATPTYVAPGHGATFSTDRPGFLVLDYHADDAIRLDAVTLAGDDGPEATFTYGLRAPDPDADQPPVPDSARAAWPSFAGETRTVAADSSYADPSWLARTFIGDENRDAWAAPVDISVLDLESRGLTPTSIGGGAQTTSLRLVDTTGQGYILRTIDKDPSRRFPEWRRYGLQVRIAEEMTAAIHPYGAFAVPTLAKAAGLYYLDPELVYIPDDPRLGPYRDEMAGHVASLETLVNGDLTDFPQFGRPEDADGAGTLYRNLDDDNDHRVDQRMFARARLFDLLIGDWDRHAGQWRWAVFEPYEIDSTLTGEARTEGKVYRPIPLDRDWAFSVRDGLYFRVAEHLEPKIQGFSSDGFPNLKGMTINSLAQDRRLTNQLTRQDWAAIADSLQRALTDSVIVAAFQRGFPDVVLAQDSARFVDRLKARRDRLGDVADRFYRLNARVVDVPASNKHERFEVVRSDDATTVTVWKTSKEGEKRRVIYRRTLRHDETDEVRLYGRGGNDQFIVTGEGRRGLTVIGVGGPGADRFEDASHVGGPGRKTRFYDSGPDDVWAVGDETKAVRDSDDARSAYSYADYQHDATQPLAYFSSNAGDGLFIGGGVRLIRHGFRKSPYARRHDVRANAAPATAAFNIDYFGRYIGVLGRTSAELHAYYRSPDNFRNFYGLGNETENVEADREFYRARLTEALVQPRLLRPLAEGAWLRIGPHVSFTRVRADAGRFVTQPQAGVSPSTFEDQWFAGGSAELRLENLDAYTFPRYGFRLSAEAEAHGGLTEASLSYGRFRSDLTFYSTHGALPWATLAVRVGGAHNVGPFPFYAANTLGSGRNLRGYRSTRFAGRSSFYQNAEARLRLGTFRLYVARGEWGVLGFVDNGRVWADGEASDAWHQGYGGGLWANALDRFVLRGSVGASSEDVTVSAGVGFAF